jgi:hypothetical protein
MRRRFITSLLRKITWLKPRKGGEAEITGASFGKRGSMPRDSYEILFINAYEKHYLSLVHYVHYSNSSEIE